MSNLTDREKSLLTDLVQLSVNVKHLLSTGSFKVEDLETIVLTQSMVEYVLENYVKKEDKDSEE